MREAILSILIAGGMLAGCGAETPKPERAVPVHTNESPMPSGVGGKMIAASPEPALRPPARFFEAWQVPPAESAGTAVALDGPPVTMNFENVDLREATRSVLGDMLGLNHAIDPRVQGRITFRTAAPIARADVLPLFEDLLRLQGQALVVRDGVYTVMPGSEAGRSAPLAGRVGAIGGVVTQAVPVRNVGAEEMAGIIRGIAAPEFGVRALPGRNLLLMTGTARELAAANDLLAELDVDALAGTSLALLYPRYARATSLAKELDPIFGEKLLPGGVRLVPLERVNALLVISRRPEHLRQVATWVERLDQRNENDEVRLFIYRVQNGRAVDLAANLDALFGKGQRQTPRANPVHGAEPGGLSMIQSRPGAGADQAGLGAGLILAAPSLLQASAPPQAARAASEGDAATVTATATATAGDEPAGLRIIPDDRNNSLLIRATAREYRDIEAALAQLDTAPLQVLIEAAIAEVTLTSDLRYGLQWLFREGDFTGTLSTLASGAVQPTFPGFNAAYLAGTDIRAVLHALESVTHVDVVSSPQLLVLNNETATLQVGDQVPVATQQIVSVVTPGVPVVNTIQFRDTGVILKVTPRVNESGLVLLDIGQEVSDVSRTTTSGIDSPTIQQRRIASTISVRDGETVALGGLIRDRKLNGENGIPVLKDVPVLGHLFRVDTEDTSRTELMVLITPRVVRNHADLRLVTDDLRRRMRAVPTIEAPPR